MSKETTVESFDVNPANLSKEFIDRETSHTQIQTRETESKQKKESLINGNINFINNEMETPREPEEVKCDTPELERKTFMQRMSECVSGNCFSAFSNEVPAEETAEMIMDEVDSKEVNHKEFE